MIPGSFNSVMPRVVAPFCRSPTVLGRRHRRLFDWNLSDDEFLALLRSAPMAWRQNLGRVLAAALVAERTGAELVFVEGWRCHRLERRAGAPALRTGAHLFDLMLRLFRRRGLLGRTVRARRRPSSRCTWEEVRAMTAFAAGAPVLGVAGLSCPSAARAGRYLRAAAGPGSAVWSSDLALRRLGDGLSSAQSAVWRALEPRPAEKLSGVAFELVNWVVHSVSEIHRGLWRPSEPLEARWARRLRADFTKGRDG
jgi:hypothetical protein